LDKLHHDAAPLAATDRLGRGTGVQGHALGPHDLAHGGAVLRLLGRQHVLGHLDQGHVSAEAVERLGQLEPDRAGAEHHQRARQLARLDRLAVGPEADLVEAVDRRAGGLAAAGDDDAAPCLEALAVHLDRPRPGDPGLAAQEGPALAAEALDRDLVVPVGGGLLDPGRHRRPRGLDRRRPGEQVDATRLGHGVGGADHHLRGDAAPVGALPSDQPALDAEHAHAGLGGTPGDLLSAHAHADHDQVGPLGHTRLLSLTPSLA